MRQPHTAELEQCQLAPVSVACLEAPGGGERWIEVEPADGRGEDGEG
jgi:hypothetical protein